MVKNCDASTSGDYKVIPKNVSLPHEMKRVYYKPVWLRMSIGLFEIHEILCFNVEGK